MRRLLGLALLWVVAVGFCTAPAAASDPALRPLNLRVEGGESAWHADNSFRLYWDGPRSAGEQELEVAAVHFRLRDAGGEIVGPETRVTSGEPTLGQIHVPPVPGRYAIELWLEAPGGETGPAATANLRFDDVRPAPARPALATGWTAGTTAVRLRLEHPAGALPISGIRGYAISVGPGAGIAPCAVPDRCAPTETDLSSGIDGDTATLGLLPEGTHTVRAVAVSGSGVPSLESSGTIRVDATAPETRLRAPAGWVGGPVVVAASAVDALSGMAPAGPGGPYTAISVDGGVPRLEPGAAAATPVAGEGVHRVAAYARDAAGNVGAGSSLPAEVWIDETPPAIAFARTQDPAEPERIEAAAVDALSGVDPDGTSIAIRAAGSRARFQPLPTSFARGKLIAHWDSDAFPPGSYEFRASARDLAGNWAGEDRRGNGTRMVLANPLKLTTLLRSGLLPPPGPRPLPYGRGATYGGRLYSVSGTPLPGLPVEVVETFAPGASPASRGTVVRTAADGSFRTRLTPGPSRSVSVRFAGSRTLSRSRGEDTRLAVSAGVHMHASSSTARVGGAPVKFVGRVATAGAKVAPAGRPVELQFRLAGRKWSEFRTVRADARGRFRYPYSFSDDDSRGVHFQFRAFVPAQDGWPYEPAGSKPVSVTGR